MTDHRFFDRAGPYSLDELAALSGARVWGGADGKQVFSDVAPLETAGPDEVTFLDNRKYVEAFVRSRAGAAFIDERFAERAPASQPNSPDCECVTTIAGPIRSSRATSSKLLLIVKYKKQYSRQEPEQPTYP